jgi:hypothetical protein
MIIISNLPRIHTFSHITDPKNPETTHIVFPIKPGANFLDVSEVKLWAKFADLADVKSMVDKGTLKLIEDPKDKGVKKKGDIPETLDGLDHSMKMELIKNTFEAETLKMWKDEETDEDVKAQLAEQLKMIEKIDKDRKEAQERS